MSYPQIGKLSIQDLNRRSLRRLLKKRRLQEKRISVPTLNYSTPVIKFGFRVGDGKSMLLKDAVSRNHQNLYSLDTTEA
jgi:hypothetical protein